jgi:hypothetical protein
MLLAALVMLANYTILPMFNTSIKYTLPVGKKIKSDIYKKPVESPITSPSDYMIIADQNLFHPERKIPTEKKEENSLPKPEFVLYGTLLTDGISLAYLEDLKAPFSSPGRGNRQIALRRGDTLSSFILKNIEADKVTMVRGEETVLVYLNDTQRPKTRETSAPPTALAPRQPAPIPGQSSAIPPTKFRPTQSLTRENYRGQKAINIPIPSPSTN